MKAQDIMTQNVYMVYESITVAEAVKKMVKKNISSLIINRTDDEDTYGIVTRRDIVNKVIAQGLNPNEVTLAEIMSKPLLTTSPNLPIKHVAHLMMDTNVRRIPVFDGQEILGIISNSDVFRGYAKHLSDEEEFLA